MTFEASPFCDPNTAGKSAPVVWHPSATLFADTVYAILLAVRTIARSKNVPLEDYEVEPVAIHAVKSVSRRTMRGALKLDRPAILRMQDSISHALDILCGGKYIARILVDQGYPQPDMNVACAWAERILKEDLANDHTPLARRWPDMEVMVRNFLSYAEAWNAQTKALALPIDAQRRCVVRMPTEFQTGDRHG